MAYKDPAKKRAYDAAYRAAHPEKQRARDVANYAAHPEKKRALSAAYRAANPDKCRARSAAWRAAHPEETRACNVAYRASTAPEIVAEQYLRERVEAMGGMCPKFVDPSRRGAPDRMVILPGQPIYFVEMKRRKFGKVSPWQERYHADLRRCGHNVYVLWSKEEVDGFFTSI
jgi:hypothetical protein